MDNLICFLLDWWENPPNFPIVFLAQFIQIFPKTFLKSSQKHKDIFEISSEVFVQKCWKFSQNVPLNLHQKSRKIYLEFFRSLPVAFKIFLLGVHIFCRMFSTRLKRKSSQYSSRSFAKYYQIFPETFLNSPQILRSLLLYIYLKYFEFFTVFSQNC